MRAQFGVPLYGGTLTGEVVYMEGNKLGCDVFERPLAPRALPLFLLVDRGDCYFIEKVRQHNRAPRLSLAHAVNVEEPMWQGSPFYFPCMPCMQDMQATCMC